MTSEPGSDIDGLMTAGRFALATMLSAKALRLYADRGLLPPRLVDPENGYRYYGDDQVRTGWLIALLRSAELSLDEIAGIVGPSAADGLASLERAADGARRRAESNQAVLARARLHLRGEPSVTEPTIRIEGDRPVLSVLRRMRPDEMDVVITSQLDRLRTIAATAGLTVTGHPFGNLRSRARRRGSRGSGRPGLPVDSPSTRGPRRTRTVVCRSGRRVTIWTRRSPRPRSRCGDGLLAVRRS